MSLERRVLDELRVGVVVLDAERRVVRWNEWMSECSGLSADAALDRPFFELFPEIVGTGLDDAIDSALSMELSTVLSRNLHRTILPLTTRSPDGPRQPMDQSVLVRPFRDREGRRLCVIQVSDVSAACRREAHLRGVAEYARMLFEAGLDPLATVDREGRITDVNRAFEKAAGSPRQDIIGSRFADYFAEPAKAKAALEAAVSRGMATDAPLRLRHRDGTYIDVLYNFTIFRGADGRPGGVFASARDLTERLKAARELEILATTDSLTELANRRHFLNQAGREVARTNRYHRELALFLIDIDHFKRVNDTHGHSAGDEVLRVVARLFRSAVRSHDVVGRMGGEEFAVLLPETRADQAAMLAERLRCAVSERAVEVRGGTIRCAISVGVAGLRPGETLDDFLIRADAALYEAKNAGRDRVVVDSV